ncbi:MAG: ABC transporter substrate-binding protein [Rhodospirillales bacterium]|nr:ABC transporter substrate-binding protein [Rhodospirillales bacterium]
MRNLILMFAFFAGLQMALVDPLAAQTASHTVRDDTGRDLVIPDHAKRIIALQEPMLAVPMLELGAKVVGSYGRATDGSGLLAVDFIATVLDQDGRTLGLSGVGPLGNIDLERIRALKPDLIIGGETDGDKVDMLSQIAPVYLHNVRSGDVAGFTTQRRLASVLGADQAFDALHADYQTKLDTVRDQLPFDPVGKTYLAVVIYDQINIVGHMSGVIQAIEDLGFTRADLEGDGEATGYGRGFAVPLSSELFARLNPDLLFVMNSYAGGKRDEDAIRAKLDAIVPGWERFSKPEREGRILFLDSAKVTTPTIASARHTLDAIAQWAAQN